MASGGGQSGLGTLPHELKLSRTQPTETARAAAKLRPPPWTLFSPDLGRAGPPTPSPSRPRLSPVWHT
eukprot:scaffold2824_cov372-Prasinococcus_capsulatus_cf.AAC.6